MSVPTSCPVAHLGCIMPVDIIFRVPKFEHSTGHEKREEAFYGAHTQYLSQSSGGFPTSEILRKGLPKSKSVHELQLDLCEPYTAYSRFDSDSDSEFEREPGSECPVEIVEMDEEKAVIKLPLHFTHPDIRPPDTREVKGTIIVALAELVEKYLLFSAMEVCNLRLFDLATHSECTIEILAFAIKHDRPALMELAATNSIKALSNHDTATTEHIRKHLDALAFVAWMRYRDVKARVESFQNDLEAWDLGILGLSEEDEAPWYATRISSQQEYIGRLQKVTFCELYEAELSGKSYINRQ